MTSFSWSELHGALTHVPVAFLMAVAVFEIGAVVLRKEEWHTVSFWLLVGAVVVAVPTLITGWITGNDLRFAGTSAPSPAIFVTHRLFAFTTSGLAILLLLWRVKTKDRFTRRARMAPLAFSVVIAACVAYTGFLGGRMVFGGASTRDETPETAQKNAARPDKLWVPVVDAATIVQGRKVFAANPCGSCHRMEGTGGTSGPDLTHEARRHSDIAWHIAHLKNPQKMKPDSDMPAFDDLPPNDLKALASYLATRK